MNMVKVIAVPMHPEGRKFVLTFSVISFLFWFIWQPFFWLGVLATLWCYYFFRDPVRSIPQQTGLILSPADGIVSLITKAVPPPEMLLGDNPLTRVSVFMNVFNCHINRAPISGKVIAVSYHHGKFLNASLDKASEHNERNTITIETDQDIRIGVIQIAGLVARRIVCFAKPQDELNVGDRFGLIRFGSRLDIFLPEGVEPSVGLGQTAVAGETIIAHLSNKKLPWSIKRV